MYAARTFKFPGQIVLNGLLHSIHSPSFVWSQGKEVRLFFIFLIFLIFLVAQPPRPKKSKKFKKIKKIKKKLKNFQKFSKIKFFFKISKNK